SVLPFGKIIMTVLNGIVSLALISFLFAAIYKVLPDRDLKWGDVVVGAVVTAVLLTVGKSLISWYIGSSEVASSFGAAGELIGLLLWVYFCWGQSLLKFRLTGTAASKAIRFLRRKPMMQQRIGFTPSPDRRASVTS